MSLAQHHRRRGMTLVELLVVISILGLLAVTVIPNISNTSDRRKVREAARALSSFIAGGQSRALGNRNGGGVWIDPLPNPIASGTLSIGISLDLADADAGLSYSGDTPSSLFQCGRSSTSYVTGTFTGGFTSTNVSTPCLIRFQGSSSLFQLTSVSGTTARVDMRPGANQDPSNTAWPTTGTGANAGIQYEIIPQPTRSSGNTLTLGDGVAIDLWHSCLGTSRFCDVPELGSVATGGANLQILYSSSGAPQYVCVNRVRYLMDQPVFLLVASIESIQSSGPLAPLDGYWVAIDPRGGVPKVAEVNRAGTILEQQSFIRSGAVQSGR